MSPQLVVLRTLESLNVLPQYIDSSEYVSFDCETTGVEKGSLVIGFSVSADLESGYYVLLREWDPIQQKLIDVETLPKAREILELLIPKKLIGHNAIFDCSMLKNNFGVTLIDSIYTDTMLLAHLIDENRRVGLKELGEDLFGALARNEQNLMKASVEKNGGVLKKGQYELYKGDGELIGKYGAQDTLLTLKLFYHFIPILFEQGLDTFFFEETMPLLRSATYDLNTIGLKVDQDKLQELRGSLEAENMELQAFISNEIKDKVKDKYPGDKKTNHFNINSGPQRSWLLFEVLKEPFNTLTDSGKEVCESLGLRLPYNHSEKREFISVCQHRVGTSFKQEVKDKEGKVIEKAKLIRDFWNYTSANAESMKLHQDKYKWVKAFLKLTKNEKILSTYVIGIQERLQYGIVNPSFLQHGTTSGRYSSRNPNLQNLPRDDKRVKACIMSRPGMSFVGADYSQLEPRVFASFSKDERLLNAFEGSSDFYSTIGIEVFKKYDATPHKEGSENAFGVKYKKLRDISKVVALSATYGTTAPKMAKALGKSKEEAQDVIDDYFENFPNVKQYMLDCYEKVKNTGQVESLFGRPRRIPEARDIKRLFDKVPHEKLDYHYRNLLNLAVNHPIQSTGASIVNRASIKIAEIINELAEKDLNWRSVHQVVQVHDSIILECPDELAQDVAIILQDCMENTTVLPGVKLEAVPKIGKNLSEV